MTRGEIPAGTEESVLALRDQLSSLQALLVLSMMMNESRDFGEILQLASTAVPSLWDCSLVGVHMAEGGWRVGPGAMAPPDVRADLEAQFVVLTEAGGALAIMDHDWGWAFPLRSGEGRFGFFVVGAKSSLPTGIQYLLRVLAQQTGIALANAHLHAKERVASNELRKANADLAQTVAMLERNTEIHERLNRVAIAGGGPEGIARVVHELTGFPVVVEDRNGNVRASVGPQPPQRKHPVLPHDELVRRAQRADQPIRANGRLLTLAGGGGDVFGVLALVDPEGNAGEQERITLEHGATVLAMELARLQSLAEAEMRIRGDLVEQLIAGTDAEKTLARAEALGWEIDGPHNVAIVEATGPKTEDVDSLSTAVRRAAQANDMGSLLTNRNSSIILIAKSDRPWSRFEHALSAELPGTRCRIGIGGACGSPSDFARSFREAELSLRMHDAISTNQAVAFDDLGIYRILAGVQDIGTVEEFVQSWLGQLLKYDDLKHAEMVDTLSQFLECGRNHAATALALAVHRNTLKYRLQRIEQIIGKDLSDPDTVFNLQLAARAWNTLRALQK